MAIYHAHIQVIGRSERSGGRSVVAAAAYRAADELFDAKLNRTHDFTAKLGVVHSEIMLPQGAPARWEQGTTKASLHAARLSLWNEVEAKERRSDAQLAREMEFAIPRELSKAEAIRLARDFVREQFVDRGMVADLNVHWDMGKDGEAKPHAHVMLTMRQVTPEGFGPKVRAWNAAGLYEGVRQRWAELANERLAELGHDVRIDYRSNAEQGIALEPQNKIGPAGARRAERGEEAERAAEHLARARRNGEAILAEPGVVLDAITRQHSTFSRRDLARFVNRHTADAEQFGLVMAKVEASAELVRVGVDGRGEARFSTRELLAAERRMEAAALALSGSRTHAVREERRRAARAGSVLGEEQAAALGHVTRSRDLVAVVGYAGTGKSTMLGVARQAWEAEGYRVVGAALSGIAAESLEAGSGIGSRTLASLEHGWREGRDVLSSRDVLVVDEAGMVGSRQMERVLSAVRAAGAKVVLVGDPEQLQAIEAGAAFRAIVERVGSVEITQVVRQREAWQREATRELATGRTAEALGRYAVAGMVRASGTRAEALESLVSGWDEDRLARPGESRVLLASTRADVAELNGLARERLRASGELGADQVVATERGERSLAAGDRVMFGRNERGLGAGAGGRGGVAVKNGTLGTVLGVGAEGGRLTVRVDGQGGSGGEGGDVLPGRVWARGPRVCGDGAQGAGDDGGPGARSGVAVHGPARGVCGSDAAPGGCGAALRARGVCRLGGAGGVAGAGAGQGYQPGLWRRGRGGGPGGGVCGAAGAWAGAAGEGADAGAGPQAGPVLRAAARRRSGGGGGGGGGGAPGTHEAGRGGGHAVAVCGAVRGGVGGCGADGGAGPADPAAPARGAGRGAPGDRGGAAWLCQGGGQGAAGHPGAGYAGGGGSGRAQGAGRGGGGGGGAAAGRGVA